MDSAIDSLSTTSEHSMTSSESTTAALSIGGNNNKRSHSPPTSSYGGSMTNNNNNNNNNSNNSGLHHHPSSGISIVGGGGAGVNTGSGGGGGGGGIGSGSSGIGGGLGSNRSSTPNSPPTSNRHQTSPLNHQMMQQMQQHHQLSPPHVSTPNNLTAASMTQRMPHIPPHSLGLLNSLQMMHHASPLELMAVAHHHVPPRSYNSPPPISTSDPTANECKLVEYRGQKVAAFIISGDTMLCLPQAFELFLKHLVGGLHTVYTKLKRLDIVPLVCNVEQVRILRGLGAIQPGVNRCKLLSCKDFDVLYRDCTTASSRPGRPPKRGPVGLSLPPTHLSQHPQLKKHRLDNGDFAYENGHMTDISRMDKSPLLANGYNPPPINHMAFMQMNHHPGSTLMSPGMPPHGLHRPDGAMMKAQAGMTGMDAIARSGIWENCRAAYEDIVKHLERLREERTDDRPSVVDQKPRDLSSRNGSPSRQSPVLNLSKSGGDLEVSSNCGGSERSEVHSTPGGSIREDENLSEDNISESDERNDKEEELSDTERERDLSHQPPSSGGSQAPVNPVNETHHQRAAALSYSTLAATAAAAAAVGAGTPPGVGGVSGVGNEHSAHQEQQSASSTETLLRNIQSLLKVAADNARQQERQISYEKAELKMDVLREREVKDSLERQLLDERKLRVLYQKRYRRERKMRIRLQQQIEGKSLRKSHGDEQTKLSSHSESSKTSRDIESKNDEKLEKCSSSDRHHRPSSESPSFPSSNRGGDCGIDRSIDRGDRVDRGDRSERGSEREVQTQPPNLPPAGADTKPWNYSGIDLMATGAFWQNYSESLAQEIEMERKARQQSADRDVKSPLQERQQAYYKNSVLFGSAT